MIKENTSLIYIFLYYIFFFTGCKNTFEITFDKDKNVHLGFCI